MAGTTSAQFVEHAGDIASYYGFRPLKEVHPELYRKEIGRSPVSFPRAASMCAQCLSSRAGEPILAFWASPSPSHPTGEFPAREAGEFSLQVSGAPQSIGEIVVLKTLSAILREWGTPIARVRVNAFGDRDSRERFARELSSFARRRYGNEIGGLEEQERQSILHNPFGMYASKNMLVREMLTDAPRPMHFLSERSRAHFKEMLEYLEHVDVPYEVDDTLGGDEREPRIAFTLDLANADKIVLGSAGGRYDEYVSKLAGKRDTATVHASVFFRKKGAPRASFGTPECDKPKMYFIQLGVRAKLQGLSVVDVLRRANIPVAQSFDASKLSPQLMAAQAAGVSYVLIMGQREALDRTIIVRSLRNSSQTIVELQALPKYLKTLRV